MGLLSDLTSMRYSWNEIGPHPRVRDEGHDLSEGASSLVWQAYLGPPRIAKGAFFVSRVETQVKRGRRVAAEAGKCARCGQEIRVGERVANERGHASHRDCIRLHVAMPKAREPQVSLGWGSNCSECGIVIVKPATWRKSGRKSVAHMSC